MTLKKLKMKLDRYVVVKDSSLSSDNNNKQSESQDGSSRLGSLKLKVVHLISQLANYQNKL
jgi:hypothetical protein